MFRRVVVLLDGSELAEQVLPHVEEVIRGRGSDVHLLSVVPAMTPAAVAMVEIHAVYVTADFLAGEAEERERIQQELGRYLEGVAERLRPLAALVQTVIRSGHAAEEILRYAEETQADLIAMCTHGRSGLSRWVYGSVADKVLRAAGCPVLLVRVHPPQPTEPPTHRRLLVPLDGSALAECVLPHVRGLVRPGQTQLHLLSVLPTGLERTVTLLTSYPPGLQISTSARSQARAQLEVYLRGVAAPLRELGASVRSEVREGNPAEEILDVAREVLTDLIVLNTHGLSGMSRWVYGSVADRVLRGASCPVLLVRACPDEG